MYRPEIDAKIAAIAACQYALITRRQAREARQSLEREDAERKREEARLAIGQRERQRWFLGARYRNKQQRDEEAGRQCSWDLHSRRLAGSD